MTARMPVISCVCLLLPTSVQGFPINYAVDGQQYVALHHGVGALAWSTIPTETGNDLYAFALLEQQLPAKPPGVGTMAGSCDTGFGGGM